MAPAEANAMEYKNDSENIPLRDRAEISRSLVSSNFTKKVNSIRNLYCNLFALLLFFYVFYEV